MKKFIQSHIFGFGRLLFALIVILILVFANRQNDPKTQIDTQPATSELDKATR